MNKHTHTAGMTLLEVMFAVALLTVVVGTLFTFTISFSDTSEVYEIKATGQDEGRRALQIIVRDLHQAVRSSVNWDQLPGQTITYRIPEDIDGNGIPVNVDGALETGAMRTIGRDTDDLNNDGLSTEQIIITNGTALRVLANYVSPDQETSGNDGIFDIADDINGNGQQDQGIFFEPFGNGVRVTIQVQGTTRRKGEGGHVLRTTLQEVVGFRN